MKCEYIYSIYFPRNSFSSCVFSIKGAQNKSLALGCPWKC